MMLICQLCYDSRGEKAVVFEVRKDVYRFCNKPSACFDIPIYELNHWRDVARFQGWRK